MYQHPCLNYCVKNIFIKIVFQGAVVCFSFRLNWTCQVDGGYGID